MKKVLLIVLILILAFSFASCKKDPYNTEEAINFIKEIKSQINHFNDKLDLAGTTSRIALTPVISDMQDIRRKVVELEIPEDTPKLEDAHKLCVHGMTKAIEGYQMFQTEEDETEVFKKLETAYHALRYTIIDLENIEVE